MATYADDIKRLARGDKLKDALGAWAARDPILGGITPYINTAFSAASNGGQSGADNSTSESTNSNGSIEQDGTKPTDGSNPNTFYKGGGGGTQDAAQTGEQDAESVINGEVPQQVPGSDYQSTNYDGPGAMTSMTNMTDCDDNDLKVRFDGQYPPPDGWDDPNTPPQDPTFEIGFYYTVLGAGDAITLQNAIDDSIAFGEANLTNFVYETTTQVNDSQWDFFFSSIAGSSFFGIQKIVCINPEVNASCAVTEAPLATEWPVDGTYDLSLKDGTFQANQYDSEAPENSGGSSVDIKYGSGETAGTGRITATAQGGYMVYATTGCGGAATGTVKVYNKDGTFAAAGDATNTFMDQYFPV